MKKISVLGAGLSATSLINYLAKNAEKYNWKIEIADYNLEIAESKTRNKANTTAVKFDITDKENSESIIKNTDIVVSLLPARYHTEVAKLCIKYKKFMLTASYVSDDLRKLEAEILESGIGIYNELGVDPGIDHMSAMKIIDKIRNQGGKLIDFFSSTGGLIAPEFDNNPWNYKFTWNPRNVVVAGQATSQFLRNGKLKYIPYHQLFNRTHKIYFDKYGEFEVYANRDSLKYIDIYKLDGIQTIFRGTIRRPGFAKAWNVFVQLGLTDDSILLKNTKDLSYREFVNSFLFYDREKSVEEKLKIYLGSFIDDEILEKIKWLGLLSDEKIGVDNVSPAMILQKKLVEKWDLQENDRDMIVMQHQFNYINFDQQKKQIISSMVVEGEGKYNTSMAITVGTPLAIATKLVANGEFNKAGIHIPVTPDLYNPILDELEEYGIIFDEKETDF